MKNGNEDTLSGFGLRWGIVRDPGKGMSARVFAAAEMVLLPASFVTFAYVVASAALSPFGVNLSDFLPAGFAKWALPVLVAAAIGYVTNWLAILMLFRPYHEHKWLFVWPQGLLPRNKAKMAREIGQTVGEKLLPPESLVAELEAEVCGYLSRPDVISKFCKMAQGMLSSHEADIVNLLVPRLEQASNDILERLLTPESIRTFWDETLAPRLADKETRDFLAAKIVEAVEANAHELVTSIREKMREYLDKKVAQSDALNTGVAVVEAGREIFDTVKDLFGGERKTQEKKKSVVDSVMDFFADEAAIGKLFSDWLAQQKTKDMFRDKLLAVGEKVGEWLKSEQGKEKLETFAAGLRKTGGECIVAYIREQLPNLIAQAFASEKLWEWVENTALPAARERALTYLSEHKEEIAGKLRLAERVEEAINKQDMATFHQMLNGIAAQHLSAIQVLGYVLGAIVGAIQLAA